VFSSAREAGALHEALYPGIVGCIDSLERRGWLLGVATGKSTRGLTATLNTHGLLHRFCTLQTADVALGKPNPDMLLRAMSETGCEPSSTVMIGDTTFDMEMARNAGTRAVGVGWGYHDVADLRSAGAEIVVTDGDALATVLRDMLEVA
jgi:phosphoglycolate phosphatase